VLLVEPEAAAPIDGHVSRRACEVFHGVRVLPHVSV